MAERIVPTSEFHQLIERISAGSEEAIWEFIETYGPHIQRVVRRRLNHNMRAKFDSIDFVQMVWASFFSDLHKIAEMRNPNELIMFLAKMAQNKVAEETRRRLKLQRYNVNRERPLMDSDLTDPQSIRRYDTPSHHLIAKERLQQITNGSSRRDRRIVSMRLNGATYKEIALELGLHERTVRHIVGTMEQATLEQATAST